jgi:hypothetical protein
MFGKTRDLTNLRVVSHSIQLAQLTLLELQQTMAEYRILDTRLTNGGDSRITRGQRSTPQEDS